MSIFNWQSRRSFYRWLGILSFLMTILLSSLPLRGHELAATAQLITSSSPTTHHQNALVIDPSHSTQNGDTLIKAGDDLLATPKRTQLSRAASSSSSVPNNIKVVATAQNDGTSSNYTEIVKSLRTILQFSDPQKLAQKLANELQKRGATAVQIAQALNYGLNFKLETIANALDEGTTFRYTDIAKGLWNSGKSFKIVDVTEINRGEALPLTPWNSEKTDFNSRDLARILENEGATTPEIAQALVFNYQNFGLPADQLQILKVVVDALDDGTTFNYASITNAILTDAFDAIWIDILHSMRDAGTTGTITLSKGLHTILAGILQAEGATAPEIAQALYYTKGYGLNTIAYALDEGTTFDYIDIARGLWGSGQTQENKEPLDAPALARILKDEGATAREIARALTYGINANLTQVTNALKHGATFDYVEIYTALNSAAIATNGYAVDAATLILNEGATAVQLAEAVYRSSLPWPSDYKPEDQLRPIVAVLKLAQLDYTNITDAVWGKVEIKYGSRILAKVLQGEGANAAQIAQALNYGAKLSLEQIADALVYGADFKPEKINDNYIPVARALRDSEKRPNFQTVARVLKGAGATSIQVARALYGINATLSEAADAMDDGAKFNYTDIAKGLWNSNPSPNTRTIAKLLRDEGANETQISQGLNALSHDLAVIANALGSDGAKFNYTNVAKGLKNSGKNPDARTIAKLLQNEGASAIQIAQALRYGINSDLSTIADALNEGAMFRDSNPDNNYIAVAKGLWNSGHAFNSLTLAGVLQNEGATAPQIARSLYYGLDFTFEEVADALDDGTTFSYTDVAKGLWNGAIGVSEYRLIKLLKDEGAGVSETVDAVASATDNTRFLNKRRLEGEYVRVALKDAIAGLNKRAQSVTSSLNEVYQDNKNDIGLVALDPVGYVASTILPPKVSRVLQGLAALVTNPEKVLEVTNEILSPLKDEAFELLVRYDPVSNLLKQSPLGKLQDFIQSRLNTLSGTIHDVLKSVGKPQTDAANTVVYVLEGDFKKAWNSLKGSSTIQSLLNAGKFALNGNFEQAGKAFIQGLGIDLPAPLEKGVNRLLKSSKAPKEGIYQLLSTTGVSVKTLKAAAGEPGFTADDQAHAIFNILAFPNIPFVSQIALAIDSGYFLGEATKQFTIPGQESKGVKKLLTGAVSAAKVQNASDWVNAAWSLRDVDFDNLKSNQSKDGFKNALASGLAAIDVDHAENWVFGAFDFAETVGGGNKNYASVISNVAIAAADINDKKDQDNIRKWAEVIWHFKDAPASADYTPTIRAAFHQMGITDQNKISAALAKGNYQAILREAITIGLQDLTSDTAVSSEDSRTLVDMAWDVKSGKFDQALQKGFSYAGFGNEASALMGALSSVRDGNYDQALTGILKTSGAPGAADLLEAGKALKGVKPDLNFDEQKKKVLISILRAVSGSSTDADMRAGKSVEGFK